MGTGISLLDVVQNGNEVLISFTWSADEWDADEPITCVSSWPEPDADYPGPVAESRPGPTLAGPTDGWYGPTLAGPTPGPTESRPGPTLLGPTEGRYGQKIAGELVVGRWVGGDRGGVVALFVDPPQRTALWLKDGEASGDWRGLLQFCTGRDPIPGGVYLGRKLRREGDDLLCDLWLVDRTSGYGDVCTLTRSGYFSPGVHLVGPAEQTPQSFTATAGD